MNPLLSVIGAEAFTYLAPLAKEFVAGFLGKNEEPVDEYDIDDGFDHLAKEAEAEADNYWFEKFLEVEADNVALRDELEDVAAERDDLRRMVQHARDAYEDMHRALYPGQY